MNPAEAKSIGRPKGTCNAEARSLAMRVELATTEATEELEKVYKSRNKKKHYTKAYLMRSLRSQSSNMELMRI
jgi:hypothetical protein